MMHDSRTWCVGPIETAEELARKLTEMTWTLCTGFELQGYLFLNDSTSEDGAQEFGVVKRLPDGSYLQVESITFGWLDEVRALASIRRSLQGEFDDKEFAHAVTPRLQTPQEHGRCPLCA
jgi:hypothetical protein